MNLTDEFKREINDLIHETVSKWYAKDIESIDELLVRLFNYNADAQYRLVMDKKRKMLQNRDTDINSAKIFLEHAIEKFEEHEPYYTVTESTLRDGVIRHLDRLSVLTGSGEGAIVIGGIKHTGDAYEFFPVSDAIAKRETN